ncbi:MAG: glutathione S-transferase family protein [Pseudomonadota bacterium]
MKHYFNPASRAVTTHWMLTELDVDHEQVPIDIQSGATSSDKFRAINPMGKIPVLVDGDVVVTEAAAICAYLADKYPEKGLAPPPGSPQRGHYYRCLFFPGTTLEPMFTTKFLGVTDYSVSSVGWGDYDRCLATVDALTPAKGWLLGDRFSAADVVFGGMLDTVLQFGWLEAPSAKLTGYVERIREREAYRKSHGSAGN